MVDVLEEVLEAKKSFCDFSSRDGCKKIETKKRVGVRVCASACECVRVRASACECVRVRASMR